MGLPPAFAGKQNPRSLLAAIYNDDVVFQGKGRVWGHVDATMQLLVTVLLPGLI